MLANMSPETVLIKLAWHLETRAMSVVDGLLSEQYPVSTLPFEQALNWCWIEFFQNNGLTTRQLARAEGDIGREFEVRVRDLTPEGLELFRTGYQAWLHALDRRQGSEQIAFLRNRNTRILERHLRKVREDGKARK